MIDGEMPENRRMKFQLLHIDGCPNTEVADARLRAALTAVAGAAGGAHEMSYEIERVRLTTAAEAAAVPFFGSPTVLLNGVDLFPGAARTEELACRVYATSAGLEGAPGQSEIEAVIRAAIADA